MVTQLATANIFVIFIILFTGFAFLKCVKRWMSE